MQNSKKQDNKILEVVDGEGDISLVTTKICKSPRVKDIY